MEVIILVSLSSVSQYCCLIYGYQRKKKTEDYLKSNKIAKSLKTGVNKSSEPDRISPRALKELRGEIVKLLAEVPYLLEQKQLWQGAGGLAMWPTSSRHCKSNCWDLSPWGSSWWNIQKVDSRPFCILQKQFAFSKQT